MKQEQFIEKYINDAFYWINNIEQCNRVQEILLEFGLTNPIEKFDPIDYHKGFTNLCTFPADKRHRCSYFQKADMWHPNARYGQPVNYEEFLNDYSNLT